MADMVTAQELENAKIDARTIGEAVNENKIVTPRYGAPFKSMPMIAEEMQSIIGTIIGGGVPASVVADNSGLSQQQVNDNNESALADRYTKSESDNLLDDKAGLSVVSLKADTFTKSEVNALVAPKADTTYVDNAVGAISTDASKQYANLAIANADIANIALNQNVFVSEAENGGYYYKAAAGSTSLTKSPYDPLTQAKTYTDTAVNELGISSNENSDISIAIVDKNYRRTWLEADEEGKPTEYSAGLISEKTADLVAENIGIQEADALGISIAIVDKNDKRTWLEANEEGKPTEYSAGLIKEAIGNDFEATPTHVKSTYQDQTIKVVSGSDIICWGDSMTQGAGITGWQYAYPAVLQALMQNASSTATVRNSGCGGETSFTIAARQGGNPMRLHVESGVIPASQTAVKMVMLDNNGKPIRPLVQKSGIPETNNDLYFDGTINGVHGRLAIVKPNGTSPIWDDANYYTFTRSEAGTEVVLNRPTPLYLDFAEARRSDIAIFWTGQNNETPSESVIADTKAMINHLKPMSKRYLVISRPKPYLNLSAQISDEEKLYLEYGPRFINVRQYLIDYGLADAGITPTSQDLLDIAAGLVPSSLRSDGTHFNNAGYAVVAKIVFERLKQLGWV